MRDSMRPLKIAKKTKAYISLALVLLCTPVVATTADLSQITRLANQGDIISQNNLGVMYSNGEGVRQDYQKAFDWFTKAANQGNAKAEYNIGVMYYNGQGVRPDYKKAKNFFGLSCDNGWQEGCDAYKDLNRRGF